MVDICIVSFYRLATCLLTQLSKAAHARRAQAMADDAAEQAELVRLEQGMDELLRQDESDRKAAASAKKTKKSKSQKSDDAERYEEPGDIRFTAGGTKVELVQTAGPKGSGVFFIEVRK